VTEFKTGDRVVYTGTLSSGRIGKHGTVVRLRESFDRDTNYLVAEIQWDDQPPPARPKGHYLTNLTLLGPTIPTLRSTWETR